MRSYNKKKTIKKRISAICDGFINFISELQSLLYLLLVALSPIRVVSEGVDAEADNSLESKWVKYLGTARNNKLN